MATVSPSESAEGDSDVQKYIDAALRPLRNRLVRYFFVFEVVLFVVAYLIDVVWGGPTTMGQHPQVFTALATILAALGIFFILLFVAVYVGLVALELRFYAKSSREF